MLSLSIWRARSTFWQGGTGCARVPRESTQPINTFVLKLYRRETARQPLCAYSAELDVDGAPAIHDDGGAGDVGRFR